MPSRNPNTSSDLSPRRRTLCLPILHSQPVISVISLALKPYIPNLLRTFTSTHLARTQPPSQTPSTSTTRSESAPTSTPPQQPLSEDILTIPNLLTISRLALTPYIGYLVATHHFVPAVTLLFIASVTDLLDGWLARKTGKYTVFGSIADPAADKALVTTMVISLAMSGMLPWIVASIILGRDVALVISAFIIRYRTLQEPKTLKRYFNPKLPSATVTPTQISKYNTFLQLLLLGLLTLYPILFPNQQSPTLSFSSTTSTCNTCTISSENKRTVESQGESKLVERTRTSLEQKGLVSPKAKAWIDKAITTLMWITAATTVYSGVGYLGGSGTGKVLAARAHGVTKKVKQSFKKPPPPSQS
ncbi:related to CRD1 - cardiolipin synthase [Melanopsichium pennsylvanicum]|uniref:Related to CRD1 - cardiolipin synthase n=2 Tax=Melanopsichium pennsylvanicum TaxID=63383 RepID=A0AAJ5C5M3_9BASI|nr:related to CRD1 - cardiolipin synthase [Melanopsichium pennsylvanicum]